MRRSELRPPDLTPELPPASTGAGSNFGTRLPRFVPEYVHNRDVSGVRRQ